MLFSEGPEFGVLTVEQFGTDEIRGTQFADHILTNPLHSNAFGGAIAGNGVENGIVLDDGLVVVIHQSSTDATIQQKNANPPNMKMGKTMLKMISFMPLLYNPLSHMSMPLCCFISIVISACYIRTYDWPPAVPTFGYS